MEKYRVSLTSAGSDTIHVIKVVRVITRSSLRKSKNIVENLGVVAEGLNKRDAKAILKKLNAAGAKAKIEKMVVDVVDNVPPLVDNTQNVSGKVLLESGLPAVGLKVKAYSKSLRQENILAETVTGNRGQYELKYPASGVRNILVRVFNTDSEEPVVTSNIILKAREKEKVDLQIEKEGYQGLSLYETIERDIASFIDGVDIKNLDDEELALLSSESGLSKEHIKLYQQAQQSDNKNLSPELLFAIAYNKASISNTDLVNLSGEKIKHYAAKSWDEHVIPRHSATTLEDKLAAHEKQAVLHQLNHTAFASKVPLRDIWSLARPTDLQFETLAQHLKESANASTEYWEKLENDESTRALVPDLKLLTQLNNLTLGNLALIKHIRKDDAIKSIEDFAGRPINEWKRLIGGDIPEEIQGETEERQDSYALGMKRMVDYLYPTKNIFTSIASDNNIDDTLKSDYAIFYMKNRDFDIQRSNLEELLESNPEMLSGVRDKTLFKEDLQINHRLFPLLPEVDQYHYLSLLRKLNLSSASNIIQRGRSGVLAGIAKGGGDKRFAEMIYSQSQRVIAMRNMLFANLWIDTQIPFSVIKTGIRQTPEWRTFFGSEDFCSCSHCMSVYSPAAYLTDCLHFLENRKIHDGKAETEAEYEQLPSVYDELNNRRPDIKHILLNCENANTPMPYIDLVNEVLEIAVLNQNDPKLGLESKKYQTQRTADQLLAIPEHVKIDVYDGVLKESSYPWSMPFDYSDQLGKTYLRQLGIEHHKIVSMFPYDEPVNSNGDLLTHEERKTKAVLNLNKTDWNILVSDDYHDREEELWGIKQTESIEDTNNVNFFLKKSQLTLDELQELVNTRFINFNGVLELNFVKPCTTTGATITGLDSHYRERILKMVRLQRKLDVKTRTLDHILMALNATEISSKVLTDISHVYIWHQEYNIPYTDLVTWFGVIPTAYFSDEENHKELYEELFLSGYEEGDAINDFQLNSKKTALAIEHTSRENRLLEGNSEQSIAVINYLIAALRVTKDEISVVIEQLGNENLTLINLSNIVGVFSTARFLKIEIDDLFTLHDIIKRSSADLIEKRQSLLEFINDIRSAGLSVKQTLLLFGKTVEGNLAVNRKNEILHELYEGLWKFDNHIEDNERDESSSSESFIFQKLSTSFGIEQDNIIRLLQVPNDLTESSFSYLVDTATGSPKSYIEILRSDELSQLASTASDNPDTSLIELDAFSPINTLFDMLSKISVLLNTLGFQEHHYQSLISAIGKENIIDLNNFKIPVSNSILFEQFTKLLKINHVVEELPDTTLNLFDLLYPGAHSESQLDELFTYQNTMALCRVLKIGSDIAEVDFTSPDTYIKLLNAVTLEKHLNIYLADNVNESGYFAWAKSTFSHKQVEEIIQVAKSKYGSNKWLAVTQQLRNSIREQQRDALLTYLMAVNEQLNTPEKIYDRLLIDTEMNSRVITSRIKLAISSVQLFVQRCLMSLESEIPLININNEERLEWEEWNWRKNYRVWEANRKVFLYPENWLEPEWRDDKSPFFKELENQLQQNELTDINAEEAYLDYLAKLESVNNLEIMAMCEAEIIDRRLSGYYIFGRTHGTPKTLYFRKYVLATKSFTAWKKIEIDFEGEHLVPAIHKARLHLFWPVFSDQSNKGAKINGEYSEPTNSQSLQLAWTQYHNDAWLPRTLTHQMFEIPQRNQKNNASHLVYLTYENNIISIHVGSTDHYHDPKYNEGLWEHMRDEIEKPIYDIFRQVDFSERFPVLLNENPDKKDLMNGDMGTVVDNVGTIWYQRVKASPYYSPQIPVIGTETIIKEYDEDHYYIPALSWLNRETPLIVQNRKLSVLFKRRESLVDEYNIIPLQATLFPDFSLNVSTYGLRSNYVYSKWNNYQNETFMIFDHMKLNPILLIDKDASTKNINSYESPAFSQYTWELFFHIPMHIANKLRQDQKFKEAQQWFHYVFNPTSSEPENMPDKYWLFQPFRDYVATDEGGQPKNIQELMRILNSENDIDDYQTFESNVHAWEQDPFSPHTVGRNRVVSYMKWVVMRYIDNLIEWADQLFRRDSIESLNEATQLYMLAWNILGEEPRPINAQGQKDKSYDKIRHDLDEFSNIMNIVENKVQHVLTLDSSERRVRYGDMNNPGTINTHQPDKIKSEQGGDKSVKVFPYDNEKTPITTINSGQENIIPSNLYFCIPQNEILLSYWGLVRDRFFKIRNSLNIEGVYRQVPLYEPPIDPALLIKAKAAGLSIAEAFSAQYQPRSHYRFLTLLQKAVDYANDVRGFGGALLSAMEKRDAERISALRSQHDMQFLDELTYIKKDQIKEIKESNEALVYSRKNIEKRRDYYAEKEFMNEGEKEQQSLQEHSNKLQNKSQQTTLFASHARQLPTYQVGTSGNGGHFTNQFGGETVGHYMEMVAKVFAINASSLSMEAAKSGQMASYVRRKEDWLFQESTAETELKQIEKQLLAAEIRMAIAQHELSNHTLQVENSKQQLELLQTKFTNTELYEWMVGQLKTLYFQSYQLAFDMAKKAEHALAYELGIGKNETESFIQYGYWDKLKEGLLSGEKLHHDLKRMESIYMQRNKRKQEVSQTFSLAMIAPQQLLNLRTVGNCNFKIEKVLFELANARLKNRKVKSVSLTIPAVTGSYTGVHVTLSNETENVTERITTSSGQNDSGLFQFNYNDERYLPFEGIDPCDSNWELEMNAEFRAFDYNTISDVLMHINYTADHDQSGVVTIPDDGLVLGRYYSLKHEFSDDWFKVKENSGEPLRITLSKMLFPSVIQNMTISDINAQRFDIVSNNHTGEENDEVTFNDDELPTVANLGVISNINELEDIILVVSYTVNIRL